MAEITKIVHFTEPATAVPQDIVADIGGVNVQTVLFISTQAPTLGVAANHAILNFGAADGTRQWASFARDEHGVTTSDVDRRGSTTYCIGYYDAGSSTVHYATFSQFLTTTDTGNNTTGVRVSWNTVSGNQPNMVAIFFAGDASEIVTGWITPNATQDLTASTTLMTQTPDYFLPFGGCYNLSDTNNGEFSAAMGVCVNDGSRTQRVAMTSSLAATPSNIGGRFENTRVFGRSGSGGNKQRAFELTSFNADGVTITTRDTVGDSAIIPFIMGASPRSVKLIDFSTPSATGVDPITGAGFTPGFVLGALSNVEAANTNVGDANAGALAVFAFDATDEYCASVNMVDNVSTTDTQNKIANLALHLPSQDGTGGNTATLDAFTSDGVDLNYSAVDAGKLGFMLLFEASGAAASIAKWPAWNLPATNKAQFRAWWPADAGNGNTVAWTLYKDSVSIDSGTINMQVNGGRFNTLSTQIGAAAGSYELEFNNSGAGGKIIFDAAVADFIPINGRFMSLFEASSDTNVDVYAHEYDAESTGVESSGWIAKADGTGAVATAQNDKIMHRCGVLNGAVRAVYKPVDNNNLVMIVRSNQDITNYISALVRLQHNEVNIYKTVNGSTALKATQPLTLDKNKYHYMELKINGALVTFAVGDLKLSWTDDSPLTSGGYFGVKAGLFTNGNGRLIHLSTITDDTPDVTSPAQVTGVTAIAQSANRIDLTWNTSAGASIYAVYGGVDNPPTTLLTTTTLTSYSHLDLIEDTAYYYQIEALDNYSNPATKSDVKTATTSTQVDTEAPDSPSGLSASIQTGVSREVVQVTLTWNNNAEAAIDFSHYNIYIDGAFYDVETNTQRVISFALTTLVQIGVSSVDTTGNESDISTINIYLLSAPARRSISVPAKNRIITVS